MDEAETLCDRVAVMDHGKVLQLGAPAELVRGLEAPVRISVAAAALTAERALALPGAEEANTDGVSTVISTHDPGPALAALAELGALDGLQVRGGTLEDLFLN